MERVEIQPAGIAQVHRALKTGKRVLITEDVQNIAQDLRAIRDTLRLEYDPAEDLFVVLDLVTERDGSTSEKLVTTWDCTKNGQLDQRLVKRVREVAAPGYNLAEELDRIDRQAERDRAHRFREQVGPAAERLKHALRKDLALNPDHIFVPSKVKEPA